MKNFPFDLLKKLNEISNKFDFYNNNNSEDNNSLNNQMNFDEELVKDFFDILLKKKLTFYELNKSEIIKKFAFYLDKNLKKNIEMIKDNYIPNKNFEENIQLNSIYKKTKFFFFLFFRFQIT